VTFLSNVLKCDVLGFNLTPERLFNVTGEAQTMRLRASSLLLSGLGLECRQLQIWNRNLRAIDTCTWFGYFLCEEKIKLSHRMGAYMYVYMRYRDRAQYSGCAPQGPDEIVSSPMLPLPRGSAPLCCASRV
jgi:hypothetical protein